MKVPRTLREVPLQPPMTPMIDVVFLLLVFFVWTSSFDEPEYDLPGALAVVQEKPRDGAAVAVVREPKLFDEVIIRIRSEGGSTTYTLHNQTLSKPEELERRLASLAASGAETTVVVSPDADVLLEAAIEVYDLARKSGIAKVLFQADQAASP